MFIPTNNTTPAWEFKQGVSATILKTVKAMAQAQGLNPRIDFSLTCQGVSAAVDWQWNDRKTELYINVIMPYMETEELVTRERAAQLAGFWVH